MILKILETMSSWIQVIVGLGLLIFIHELGHFLMAKRNGVRVEAFSLGMGPVIWKRLWKGTEYRLSIIPLGGYVKMAGENIGDPKTGAADELSSKSAWQRFQIFVAGALMNLIIAFPIAILCYLLGRLVVPAEIAAPGHPETLAGMKPGDVITEVDGVPVEEILTYQQEIVRRALGSSVPLKVLRDGQTVELTVKQSGSERHRMVPITTKVANLVPDGLAARAGMRERDIIETIDGVRVLTAAQIGTLLESSPGKTLTFGIRRDQGASGVDRLNLTLAIPEKKVTRWPVDNRLIESVVGEVPSGGPLDVRLGDDAFMQKNDGIVAVGDREIRNFQELKDAIEPSAGKPLKITRTRGVQQASLEIVPGVNPQTCLGMLGMTPGATKKVATVPENSHYHEQGLRSGDVVEAIDGKLLDISVMTLWEARTATSAIPVVVLRGGERKELRIAPREDTVGDVGGVGFQLGANTVMRHYSLKEAIAAGVRSPYDVFIMTWQLLFKLVRGQEKATGLSGPIGIISVASDQAQQGPGNLLWLLVVITVNLGVFNLLPVPILDGGHVLLLVIEKLRGQPPSPRFVERFQLTGLVLLLGLILFVTYNDIGRLLPGGF